MKRGNESADHASGLLLHPSIGRHIDETVVIQGHAIRFATVDLAGTAPSIRNRLLRLVALHRHGGPPRGSIIPCR